MAFKVGQKVVCVSSTNEWFDGLGNTVQGPKKDEILKVDFIKTHEGHLFLGFNKYCTRDGYDHVDFRPLDYDFVEEVIKQVTPKEVEA